MFRLPVAALIALIVISSAQAESKPPRRRTEVAIAGDKFLINGKPTYEGSTWQGHKLEGLLFNSRMVQGIFDDLKRKKAFFQAEGDHAVAGRIP